MACHSQLFLKSIVLALGLWSLTYMEQYVDECLVRTMQYVKGPRGEPFEDVYEPSIPQFAKAHAAIADLSVSSRISIELTD